MEKKKREFAVSIATRLNACTERRERLIKGRKEKREGRTRREREREREKKRKEEGKSKISWESASKSKIWEDARNRDREAAVIEHDSRHVVYIHLPYPPRMLMNSVCGLPVNSSRRNVSRIVR